MNKSGKNGDKDDLNSGKDRNDMRDGTLNEQGNKDINNKNRSENLQDNNAQDAKNMSNRDDQ